MDVLVKETLRDLAEKHQMRNITEYLAAKAAYQKQQREEKERSEVTQKKTLKQIIKEALSHGANRPAQEGVQNPGPAASAGGGPISPLAAHIAANYGAIQAAGAGGGVAMNPFNPGVPNSGLGQQLGQPLPPGAFGPNLPLQQGPVLQPYVGGGYTPGPLHPAASLGPRVGGPPFVPLRAGWTGEVAQREKPIEGWREYHLVFEHAADGEDMVKIQGAGRHFMMLGRRAQAQCEVGTANDTALVRSILDDEEVFALWLSRRDHDLLARCRHHLEHDPEGCSCGFYGRNKEYSDYGAVVHARVSAFGVVVCDDKGNWRASDIELEELLIYPSKVNVSGLAGLETWLDWQRITDLLRDRYACPVKLVR